MQLKFLSLFILMLKLLIKMCFVTYTNYIEYVFFSLDEDPELDNLYLFCRKFYT